MRHSGWQALFLVPLLMGARCSPTRPACASEGACDGLSRPQRSCINFCAEQWDPNSGTFPLCPVDPCDESAFARPDVVLCPDGYRCVGWPFIEPGLENMGRCMPAVGEFLEQCGHDDLDGPYDQCGTGLVCLEAECSEVVDFATTFRMPLPATPVCFLPRREGQTCDSNLADRDHVDPATGQPYRVGCMPCEYGTWCIEDAISGYASGTERRCLRTCSSSTGDPDSSLCGCDRAICGLTSSEHVTDSRTNTFLGKHFCEPCIGPHTTGCATGTPCCDEGYSECMTPRTVDAPSSDQNMVCCRPEGMDCSGDANPDSCCSGTFCDVEPGTSTGYCQACGVDSDGPLTNQPCCPGYYRVEIDGFARCVPCADVRALYDRTDLQDLSCSNLAFWVEHQAGTDVDAAFIPADRPWPRTFRGAIGGELVNTGGLAAISHQDLHRNHRTWLFQQDLTTGIRPGEGVVLELPRTDGTGGPRVSDLTVPSPGTPWHSYRIYDSGECSMLFDWDQLAVVLSAQINREIATALAGSSLVSGLQTPADGSLTITPVLRADTTGVPGVMIPRDMLEVSIAYETTGLAGCADASFTLDLPAEISLQPGFLPTAQSNAQDANAAQVGCVLAPSGEYWACTLPAGSMDALVSATFPHRDDYWLNYPAAFLTSAMSLVGCIPNRGSYSCTLPEVLDDPFCDPAFDSDCPCVDTGSACYLPNDPYEPWLLLASRSFARGVNWVPGAHDVAVSFPHGIHADVSDVCAFEPIITALIESRISAQIALINDALGGVLGALFGTNFVNDYGVSSASLPGCADSSGSPDDSLCQAVPLFGGQRHTCGTSATGSPICEGFHIEPRRINIRPDGLEFVLAEDSGDPQFALFSGLTIPVGGSSGLSLCAYNRFSPIRVGESVMATPSVFNYDEGRSASLGGDRSSPFCATTDPLCSGICPQTGTVCAALPIQLAGFTAWPPGTVRCRMGQCCNASMQCVQ